jgi:myo-inositol-1(or 4)-monophosphatase
MLTTAIHAAYEAGELLRRNFGKRLKIHQSLAHDIKLEMDVRAQQTIERAILKRFADHAIVGEEGVSGAPDSDYRWIIDPIDGTVNYTYRIPHFCVSIACQKKTRADKSRKSKRALAAGWTTIAGVIYDPMRDEMFTASETTPARLNGKPIRASSRTALSEAIIAIGFFKTPELIERSLPHFQRLIHRARKIRIMGAAAIDLAYVACGRYDVYLEYGVKLWDVAAGLHILEKAGGVWEAKATGTPHTYDVFASGKVDRREVVRLEGSV